MTLEQELQTEGVTHLHLSGFSQVTSETAVRDVLALMREEEHNVCLIVDDGKLIGVFTDRDVLRKVATAPETWERPVKQVMTPLPITIKRVSSAADALRIMDDNHFRNLPVVGDGGSIIGNMTYRAVIEYLATRYPVEVLNQPPNPEHIPTQQEGG